MGTFIDTESRMVVFQGWRRNGDLVYNGVEFRMMKMFWRWMGATVAQQCECS